VPIDFVVPSLCIAIATQMSDEQSLQQQLDDLMQLEEDCVMAGFNQVVEKQICKAWNDYTIQHNFTTRFFGVVMQQQISQTLRKVGHALVGPISLGIHK
jgi:hypothetical protein